MDSKEPQGSIAEIMAGIEEMISGHYTVYAEQFDSHRDFWLDLAAEELAHAKWIRELYAQTKTGMVIFHESRFNRDSLREISGRMEEMLADFRAQTKTMKDALQSSLNIENFILEKKYLEIFDSDVPKLKFLFERLEQETEGHRNKMREMLLDFQ
jgi:rubrerythrin